MITTKLICAYVLGAVAGAVIAMTPEMVTALGAMCVGVITAAGVVIVNILTVRKLDKVKAIGEQNLSETQVVKGHVNSAAAASEAKIEGLRKELLLMQTVAADKKETAALLAQSAATAPHVVQQGIVDSKAESDKVKPI